MGKIKKLRVKTKPPTTAINKNDEQNDKTETNFPNIDPIPQSISQVLPKDFDLASVRSFKSMKNKFGIKKQIKKTDKLKLKKEILKQKIDTIKEAETKNKKFKKGKKGNGELPKAQLPLFQSVNADKKTIVKDEEEEYVKLEKKSKGIQKKGKRKRQMVKDINMLKHLMGRAKNSVKS